MDLHSYVTQAFKIGVFGSGDDHCSSRAMEIGYQVGELLAERGAVIFTGGRRGVMEAASKGAAEKGGLAIGILPGESTDEGNQYLSLRIPTGIGFARGQILTNTVDGAILVEGGLGTMAEAAFMYWWEKPTVAIVSSGGVAADVAGKSLDRRGLAPILSAESAAEAVEVLFEKLRSTK
jgi:uncharacterized protein (TIGR00725 family)